MNTLFDAIRRAFGDEAEAEQTPQQAIFHGLNTQGKHVYAGTVPPAEVRRRRNANKRARDARRGRVLRQLASPQTRAVHDRRRAQVQARSSWANR